MRADDEVDLAAGQPVEHGLLLLGRVEAAHRGDLHREGGVALGEGAEVLLHQQRGRHQDGDLLAVGDGLEGGPDGDLGLAVADVAADQPVHRDDRLHVGLDLVDHPKLVRRLAVGEGVFQLALPGRIGTEGVARRCHPGAVEPDQLGGDLLDGLPGPALALGPVGAADPVQARTLTADVTGDLLELVGGDVKPVAAGVFEHQIVAGGAGDGAGHHLQVAADAVLLVDDEIAGHQLERVDALAAPARHPAAQVLGADPAGAGQIGLGERRPA